MSKTAYEIESELGGSSENRTGFGGRPQLINFYVESRSDLSALPVLDQMTIDALRCGKIIPVLTIAEVEDGTFTGIPQIVVGDGALKFAIAEEAGFVYTIETKTWAFQGN